MSLGAELLLVTVEKRLQDAKNVEDLGVVLVLLLQFVDNVK